MAEPSAGTQFTISTQNVNFQAQSSVATLTDGRVVVVWQDLGTTAGEIKGRILNADGTPSSAEFIVNVAISGRQDNPKVTALAGGGFAVAWEDYGVDPFGDIRARAFDATGTATTLFDLQATPWTGNQQGVSITGTETGSFIVGWWDGNTTQTGLSSSSAAMAREYAADGALISGAVRVSGDFGGDFGPVFAARDGQLVAVWDDDGGPSLSSSDGDGIYTRTYAGTSLPGGTFIDGGTRVDTGTFRESSRKPDVAITAAGTAIVWEDQTTGSDGIDVYLKLGAAAPVRINTTTGGEQGRPQIARLADGGFVVVWVNFGAAGGSDIRARVFDATGTPTSADFLVSTPGALTSGGQITPDVTALIDGRFMITWSDETTTGGIAGRVFDPRFGPVSWAGTNAGEQFTGTDFADSLFGRGGGDTISGGGGRDTLLGGNGFDVLDGGAGTDTVDYFDRVRGVSLDLRQQTPDGALVFSRGLATPEDRLFGFENVIGSQGADTITGSNAANRLDGGAGNDTLDGAGGADTLEGGTGRDTLTGGNGADRFEFSTVPTGQADEITDFVASDEILAFAASAFAAIGPTLEAGEIRFGGAAQDADDRLIYAAGSGNLWYDADGDGAGTRVLVARLANTPTLGFANFELF